MCKDFFYLLSNRVSIREENRGAVLLLNKDNKDYSFFYVSDPSCFFKEMIDKDILLKISINFNKGGDNEKKMLFLSSMLKEGILFCYQGDVEEKRTIELKKVPEIRYLFITPTMHFRKVYSYEK